MFCRLMSSDTGHLMNLAKYTCWGSMSDRIPSIETPQLRTAPF